MAAYSLNFRTLDLNLLRVLDVVLTERSLTRAARQLSMTQPAVSNAMKRLRDALGRLAGGAGVGGEEAEVQAGRLAQAHVALRGGGRQGTGAR